MGCMQCSATPFHSGELCFDNVLSYSLYSFQQVSEMLPLIHISWSLDTCICSEYLHKLYIYVHMYKTACSTYLHYGVQSLFTVAKINMT